MTTAKETTAYLAPIELDRHLSHELGDYQENYGRLFVRKGKPKQVYWCQNIWYDPQIIEISSIGDAAKKLKAIQRNWALYSHDFHRRAKLIESELPHVSAKPLKFPAALPTAPLGSWTLINKDTILASPHCSSPFPNGEVHFVEDKDGPPNRAYLKLWEAFTLFGKMPQPGERCLEVGSSPGGWTYVLGRLGARVLSIDRTPLAPKVAALQGVEFLKGNAFNYTPETKERFDWLFCDLACYPEKLFDWVKLWRDSGQVKNFVCTLKFQSRPNADTIRAFAKIPGSELIHLSANKHELTWVKLS